MTRPLPRWVLGAAENELPEPKPRFPRWLRDMSKRDAAILMVTIWAGTFLAIWRLNP